MAIRTFAGLLVLACGGWLLFFSRPSEGCAPYYQASFALVRGSSLEESPQEPREILLPSYRRASLVLAYRYLAGLRLGGADLEHWAKARATGFGSYSSGIQKWREARAAIQGASPWDWIPTYREYRESHWGFVNCLEDAFGSAATRLEEHSKRFGPKHPGVADWLRAQNMVFQNCDGRKDAIPPPAAADLPPEIRADRAYQIAAAKFYAMRYREAEEDFRAIAGDTGSPWRTLAPYLAARCIVRNATARPTADDPGELARAEAELQRILADDSLRQIHEPARKLLATVVTRLRPLDRLLEASRTIQDPARSADLYPSVKDYTIVLPNLGRRSKDLLVQAAEADDLTDWVLTFEGKFAEEPGRALARWKAKGTLPWLVAAISGAQPQDPAAGELVAAAGKAAADSPAYPTLLFHSLRLLAETDEEQARGRLDAALGMPRSSLSPSTRNVLLAMRMKLARDLDEFLRDAPRLRTGTDDGSYFDHPAETQEWLFDADAGSILREQLPLRMLAEAASSPRLPARLRREVALSSWTRAVLLDDGEAAATLAKEVIRLEPALAAEVERYLKSPNEMERRFNAASMLLRNPGLRPAVRYNLLREAAISRRAMLREDNWWCPPRPEWDNDGAYSVLLRIIYPPKQRGQARFLDEASRLQATRERERLLSLPAAPTYIASGVVNYARAHPEDPRMPELLHLTVMATRYACNTDSETGKYSKAAFDLLHRRYPKSPWTQKTPYWYK